MTAASNTKAISKGIVIRERRRRIIMGVIFLAAALFIWLVFSANLNANAVTTYVMTPGGSNTVAPNWVFQTAPYLNVIAGVLALIGAFQVVRGFGKYTYGILALVAILFLFAFLSWATAGGETNLAG